MENATIDKVKSIHKATTYRTKSYCFSMALSVDHLFLLAGVGQTIEFFSLLSCNGKIRLINKILAHKDSICSLTFMPKRFGFLSGSYDFKIKMWLKTELWSLERVLQGHQGAITSIIINQNETLIFSKSQDSIKVWSLEVNWDCIQNITPFKDITIDSIMINNSCNTLLSFNFCATIMYLNSQSKQWEKRQNIKQERFHHSQLCFIFDDLFCLIPDFGKYLRFYKYDSECQTYVKIKEINLETYGVIKPQFQPRFFEQSQNFYFRIQDNLAIIKISDERNIEITQLIYHQESSNDSVQEMISEKRKLIIQYFLNDNIFFIKIKSLQ